jgi:broad specificity phosphatase PhoE
MRIFLVRHGRPEAVNRYSPFDLVHGSETGRLTKEYSESPIDKILAPPPELAEIASHVPHAYSSSLRRAVDSAHMLKLENRLTADALFNEAGIPNGYLKNWLLPAGLWMGISRVSWYFGFACNSEPISEFRNRVNKCADMLQQAAQKKGSVMLVGHGCINAFIYRRLKKMNWKARRAYKVGYWAVNRLEA